MLQLCESHLVVWVGYFDDVLLGWVKKWTEYSARAPVGNNKKADIDVVMMILLHVFKKEKQEICEQCREGAI